jgi:hypothetical protein
MEFEITKLEDKGAAFLSALYLFYGGRQYQA